MVASSACFQDTYENITSTFSNDFQTKYVT